MVTKFVVMLGLIGVTMAEHCETAWARLPDALSTNGERECFLDNADLNPNRWGWTNEIDGSAGWPLEIPIYAAAGRCDISKGWGIVGTLVVTYSEGVVNVKYESDSGFHYNDYHLFVSKSQYNTKKDGTTYTVAPGQFPFNHQSEVEVQGMTTPFFIQAHAVACSGDPPVTYHPTSPVTAPPSVAATAPPTVATAPPSVATA
eukprot:Hpha_TRINITY_DN14941_c2_g7::TRINITY_DN14941_c2_g7_i7::g.143588::m.143588